MGGPNSNFEMEDASHTHKWVSNQSLSDGENVWECSVCGEKRTVPDAYSAPPEERVLPAAVDITELIEEQTGMLETPKRLTYEELRDFAGRQGMRIARMGEEIDRLLESLQAKEQEIAYYQGLVNRNEHGYRELMRVLMLVVSQEGGKVILTRQQLDTVDDFEMETNIDVASNQFYVKVWRKGTDGRDSDGD